MRRLRLGAIVAALATLVVTSIAAAHERRPTTIMPVSAHFSTTGNVDTRTCTRGAVTFLQKRGTFTGTSTSADPRLNGTIRISLRLLVNTSNGFGIATGKLRIRSATRGQAQGDLSAVVSGGNRLDGFGRGRAENRGGSRRLADQGDENEGKAATLFANFTATLAGSSLTGDLGAGAHGNAAVIGGGGCEG
jgi:hypothetical protein